MDGEQDEQPTTEPTIQPDPSVTERRLLALLSGRQELAANLVGRLSPRIVARRGLALVGHSRVGLGLRLAAPAALPSITRVRREADPGQVERFWWRRLTPHRVMLGRRRPVASDGSTRLSRGVREGEAQAGQPVALLGTLDAPALDLLPRATEAYPALSDTRRTLEGGTAGAADRERQLSWAEPAERAEPASIGAPTRRAASAVWQRLVAVLRPARGLARGTATPAAPVDRSPGQPAPTDILAASLPSPRPVVAPELATDDEPASSPRESATPRLAPPVAQVEGPPPRQSDQFEPDARVSSPSTGGVDRPTATHAVTPARLLAAGAVLPDDALRTPAEEIAPLASTLVRRSVASMAVVAGAVRAASPSPTRLFWWPAAVPPSAPPGSVPRQHFPTPAGSDSRHAPNQRVSKLSQVTTPVHPVRAPGLLGAVLEVHRAAVTPTSRLLHFTERVRQAQRPVSMGAADPNRWRVRSVLAARSTPTSGAPNRASDELREQSDLVPGGEKSGIEQPAGSGMDLRPTHEDGGTNWPAHPRGLAASADRAPHATIPGPDSESAGPSLAPPVRSAWLPLVRGFLNRLGRRTPPAEPRQSAQPGVPTHDPRQPGDAEVADPPNPPSFLSVQMTRYVPVRTPRLQREARSTEESRAVGGVALGRSAGSPAPATTAPAQTTPGGEPFDEAESPRSAGLFQHIRRRFDRTRAASQPVVDLGQPPTRVLPPPSASSNARRSTAPGRSPASSPEVLPERPSDVSDAQLAEVIRRLPGPMAAAALAAGLLGEAAAEAALERSRPAHAALELAQASPSQASRRPRATQHGLLTPSAAATTRQVRNAATTSALPPLSDDGSTRPTSVLGTAGPYDETHVSEPPEAPEFIYAPSMAWSPTEPQGIPDRAWSTPLETQHAPLMNYVSSSINVGASGAATALAAGGLSAAPLERDVVPVAAPETAPGAAAHAAGPGDSHAASSAAAPAAKELDRLAEEVLQKLRWRLGVERERLMG